MVIMIINIIDVILFLEANQPGEFPQIQRPHQNPPAAPRRKATVVSCYFSVAGSTGHITEFWPWCIIFAVSTDFTFP